MDKNAKIGLGALLAVGATVTVVAISANSGVKAQTPPVIPVATTGNVTGEVTDSITGLPIPGVTVSGIGIATTDNNGVYTTAVTPGDYNVHFDKSGYQSSVISFTVKSGSNTLNTTLVAIVVVTELTIAPSGNLTSIPLGSGLQFGAIATYSDGTTKNVTSDTNYITWSSLNPNIATINYSGSVQAVSLGTTVISAVYQGLTSNPVTLTVVTQPSTTTTAGPTYTGPPPGTPNTTTYLAGTDNNGNPIYVTEVTTMTPEQIATFKQIASASGDLSASNWADSQGIPGWVYTGLFQND